jgi:tellurite resistance-related uncharacterized protein
MKDLPESITAYKKTPIFSNDSIPKGLLNAHQTKAGTWGKIIVLEGELLYRILEPKIEEYRLSATRFGVIEPEVLHEVSPIGNVSFYVEFYK